MGELNKGSGLINIQYVGIMRNYNMGRRKTYINQHDIDNTKSVDARWVVETFENVDIGWKGEELRNSNFACLKFKK